MTIHVPSSETPNYSRTNEARRSVAGLVALSPAWTSVDRRRANEEHHSVPRPPRVATSLHPGDRRRANEERRSVPGHLALPPACTREIADEPTRNITASPAASRCHRPAPGRSQTSQRGTSQRPPAASRCHRPGPRQSQTSQRGTSQRRRPPRVATGLHPGDRRRANEERRSVAGLGALPPACTRGIADEPTRNIAASQASARSPRPGPREIANEPTRNIAASLASARSHRPGPREIANEPTRNIAASQASARPHRPGPREIAGWPVTGPRQRTSPTGRPAHSPVLT